MRVAKIVEGITQGASDRNYARTESRPATASDLPQEEPTVPAVPAVDGQKILVSPTGVLPNPYVPTSRGQKHTDHDEPDNPPGLPQEEDPSELFVPPGPQQLFQQAWASAQLECRDRVLLDDIEARAECFTTIVLGLNRSLRDNASTVLMGAPVKVRTRINPMHKSVLNLVSSYFLGFGWNVAWRPSGRPDGLITEVSGGQGRTTLLMDLYIFPIRCQQMKSDPEASGTSEASES